MPVQLTKQMTTVDEFTDWQAYFIRRRNEPDKIDWYHAATIHAIYRTMGGSKGKIEDHLLKFETPKPKVQDPEHSKAIWMAAYGINPDGTWTRPNGT